MKEYPRDAVVHGLDGSLKLVKNDLAGARAAFEQALKISPDFREGLIGLTFVDLRQNRVADARARIDAWLAAKPNTAGDLRLAAQVSAAQRDLPRAETELRRAIQVDPADSRAYAMLAGVLLGQNKLDAALTEFDQMAARDPKNVGARTMAAMILDRQQKPAEAKKRYEAIVADQPSAAVASNNLAWIYAEEGANLDTALRLAQAAAAQLPDNPEVQDTIGWIYYKKDLPALAIPAFEKSVEKAPENAGYHYHLALAHAKAGDAANARRSVDQALKLRPDYPEAQKLLASLK